MDRKIIVFGTTLVLLILLGGFFLFSQSKKETTTSTPTEVPAVASNQTTLDGAEPANLIINSQKLSTNYFVFEKSEYEKAKAANRPILLFFYANWCPTCSRQEPINVTTFNSLGQTNLIIFRVNYNDTDTSKDEESLAKELAIPYQHNFRLFDRTGNLVESFQGDTPETTLKEKLSKVN